MSVRVRIGSQLRSYTDGAAEVEAAGADVAAILSDLDARFPGLAFRVADEQGRIRRHMHVFVAGTLARRADHPCPEGCELLIVGALSGG